MKINNNGDLQWNTSIGGSLEEFPSKIIVSQNNNIYIVGRTLSQMINGMVNNGLTDGFITKLDLDGKVFGTSLVGGSGDDIINSVIALTDDEYVFIAGETKSTNFYQLTKYGQNDGFTAKMKICSDSCEDCSSTDLTACLSCTTNFYKISSESFPTICYENLPSYGYILINNEYKLCTDHCVGDVIQITENASGYKYCGCSCPADSVTYSCKIPVNKIVIAAVNSKVTVLVNGNIVSTGLIFSNFQSKTIKTSISFEDSIQIQVNALDTPTTSSPAGLIASVHFTDENSDPEFLSTSSHWFAGYFQAKEIITNSLVSSSSKYGGLKIADIEDDAYWIWDSNNSQNMVFYGVIRGKNSINFVAKADNWVHRVGVMDSSGVIKKSEAVDRGHPNNSWTWCRKSSINIKLELNDYLFVDACNDSSGPDGGWGIYFRAHKNRSMYEVSEFIYMSIANTKCANLNGNLNIYYNAYYAPTGKSCFNDDFGDVLWSSHYFQCVRCRMQILTLPGFTCNS